MAGKRDSKVNVKFSPFLFIPPQEPRCIPPNPLLRDMESKLLFKSTPPLFLFQSCSPSDDGMGFLPPSCLNSLRTADLRRSVREGVSVGAWRKKWGRGSGSSSREADSTARLESSEWSKMSSRSRYNAASSRSELCWIKKRKTQPFNRLTSRFFFFSKWGRGWDRGLWVHRVGWNV